MLTPIQRAACSSLAFALLLVFPFRSSAQSSSPPAAPPQSGAPSPPEQTTTTVRCESKPGQRVSCPADTSAGVVLQRSSGEAPCLLGKSWGYDQTSVWVSDGCSGDFLTGQAAQSEPTKRKAPFHVPNVGFLLFDGEKGQIYFRLFSYAR